jgi:FixJ family two-component response regulator
MPGESWHGARISGADDMEALERQQAVRSPSRLATLGDGFMPATRAEATEPVVLIVDDDEDVRTSLQELMLSVDIETSCFASSREFLEATLPERPGCLLLDVRMPGTSGLDVQQQLALRGNTKPIIFITGYGDVPMTVQAMKAGAVDFLTKPFRDQTVLDAVVAAIELDVAQQAGTRTTRHNLAKFATLTRREQQVMRAVSLGRLNKQIAYDLGITEVTVKLHRGNVMRKMHAASIGELIRAWESLPCDVRGKEQS